MNELSLDDIFNGSEEVEAVEEVIENEETQEEVTEEITTEETTEETTGDKEEASTPEAKNESDDWKFKAYQDEKRKRQELERQLEELNKQPEEKPDIWEDPKGYETYQTQQIDQKVTAVKAEMSQFFAEKEFGKDKVQAAFDKFSEMVKDEPSLYNKAISSTSPYHEIVSIVEKAEKFERMQNIEQYEAELKAKYEQELREKLEKEFADKYAKKSVTPSLNTRASISADDAPEDLSLNELFGR